MKITISRKEKVRKHMTDMEFEFIDERILYLDYDDEEEIRFIENVKEDDEVWYNEKMWKVVDIDK